ncbi:MAG: zincin-like metallopeptidase domain-containing protein [Hyphomicrobium sp.]
MTDKKGHQQRCRATKSCTSAHRPAPPHHLRSSPDSYKETLHWKGLKSRLDRRFTRIGTQERSVEELAELGSAFLCEDLSVTPHCGTITPTTSPTGCSYAQLPITGGNGASRSRQQSDEGFLRHQGALWLAGVHRR